MRDRWDRLSDTNRKYSVLSERGAADDLIDTAESLHRVTNSNDRELKVKKVAYAWRCLDTLLDAIGVSRDELFAAVCSQVDPQLSAEVNADTDSTESTDVRKQATSADEPGQDDMAINAAFLRRLRLWSAETFGGQRPVGILDHLRKEVEEIAEDPTDVNEWVDAILLALDGAMSTGHTPKEVIRAVHEKMTVNEKRDWPAPDPANADKAVEHIGDDAPSEAHDRLRVFVDGWKEWSASMSTAWMVDESGKRHEVLLEDLEQVLADLESQQPVEDLTSTDPIGPTPDLIIIDDPVPTSRPPTPSDDSLKTWAEQARAMPGVHVATWWEPVSADLVAAIDKVEATVAVLTAIEGNMILAADVLYATGAYSTIGGAADSISDCITDAVEFMSHLPKTMRGTDSTDPAMVLLDVNLSVVDWKKVAETVLGWSED